MERFGDVTFAVANHVATVTIDRPHARNALSEDVRAGLDASLERIRAGAGDAIRSVVLTGAGGAFCAGGDIGTLVEFAGRPAAATRRRMRDAHDRVRTLINLDLPVIAAVDGAAAGAGFSLALACDFILASPRARFIMSFARIGLVPDWGAFWLLPRIVGLQMAKELVFSARTVDTEEAAALGIVHRIHPAEELAAAAQAFAERFNDASPLAIGLAKQALNRSFQSDLDAMLDAEASGQALANNSAYHRDAAERFLAKEPLAFAWERYEKDS
ncbi:MAG: enoyl-CoA hydratase/isomerase family protein [Alphaproteobacteria bacterium]|jgi:2-(1,2-epoxy-1,2-dihydrophenyl)acetyl-CoA isomerase